MTQTVDYSGVADRSDGTLPNYDGGQVTNTVYMTTPAGNKPIVSGGAATLSPTAQGQIQGWYHQWNVGTGRTTKVSLSWMWTENKPGNNNGPVIGITNGALSTNNNGTGLNVPGIACHLGIGQQSWHIDVPGGFFTPFSTVKAGNFTPALTYGYIYTVTLEYTAADTIRLTLPDSSVVSGIQHPLFNQNAGSWAFSEIYLGNAITESNVKITKEIFDTTQWQGSTPPPPPPPPPTATTSWEPYCRTHASALPLTSDEPSAIAAANAHVVSNPGHSVQINELVH